MLVALEETPRLDYDIKSGTLYYDGKVIAKGGKAGNSDCVNDGSERCVSKANVGPLPPGDYQVGKRDEYNDWSHPAIPLWQLHTIWSHKFLYSRNGKK